MKIKVETQINEAIKLEINMYKLYTLFQEIFPEDSVFWKGLASEERNHIVILRKIKPFLPYDQEFSDEFFSENINTMIQTNNKVNSLLNEFKQNPDRNIAFEKAIEIENSASELHYQNMMNKETNSKLAKIFNRLNVDDNDHAKRIKSYSLKKEKQQGQ